MVSLQSEVTLIRQPASQSQNGCLASIYIDRREFCCSAGIHIIGGTYFTLHLTHLFGTTVSHIRIIIIIICSCVSILNSSTKYSNGLNTLCFAGAINIKFEIFN